MSVLWILAQREVSTAADDLHPHVQEYRSGGIGHLKGDESRSVVGMVPTHVMERYREHNGNQQHPSLRHRDREVIDGIRQDIRNGVGIKDPMMLEHDPDNHWGSIGEGNHRLAAAREEGISHVPVRVVSRSRDLPEKAKERAAKSEGGTGGAPLHMETDFGHGDWPYTPPEVHPHHFTELKP